MIFTIMPCALFRFYEELNDFLPADKRKTTFAHEYIGSPSVKDAIEKLGIPHSEVDLILVNGEPVEFTYHLKSGDRIAVYPVFESFDISGLSRLPDRPLRKPRFIADVHLGKLAKYLRLLGLDTLYENCYDDSEIVHISGLENRIVLTRDSDLLKVKEVTHGYFVRSQKIKDQIEEILQRFDLWSSLCPFSRCLRCNGEIKEVFKEWVMDRLPPRTGRDFQEFFQCSGCNRIYWKGSHYERMTRLVERLSGLEV